MGKMIWDSNYRNAEREKEKNCRGADTLEMQKNNENRNSTNSNELKKLRDKPKNPLKLRKSFSCQNTPPEHLEPAGTTTKNPNMAKAARDRNKLH